MISSLGWIDFSSEHRERVKTVLDLLATPGVVDELGIGVVRDAFADHLFPGISTIQTRAKYFIIIPRLLKDYEALPDRQRRTLPLAGFLTEREKQCRIRLVQKYGKQEHLGIIGVTFGTRPDKDVQRQPSSVYWNGLRAFGLVKTDLSLAEYCHKFSGHRPSLRMLLAESREERGDDADAEDLARSLVTALPPAPEWSEKLAITLSRDEASFLRQQIVATQPDSLLGQILLNQHRLEQFLALPESDGFPQLAALPFIKQLPDPRLRQVVSQAKLFWDLLSGAHIRYNCLLQERFGVAARAREFTTDWTQWRRDIQGFPWAQWSTEDLWACIHAAGGQLNPGTRAFIEKWLQLARDLPRENAPFDQCVVQQECRNKRSRARLRPDNRDERVEGWLGIGSLNYRFSQARTIINDIYRAESGKASAHDGF